MDRTSLLLERFSGGLGARCNPWSAFPQLAQDRATVAAAVAKDGLLLEFASESLQADPKVPQPPAGEDVQGSPFSVEY